MAVRLFDFTLGEDHISRWIHEERHGQCIEPSVRRIISPFQACRPDRRDGQQGSRARLQTRIPFTWYRVIRKEPLPNYLQKECHIMSQRACIRSYYLAAGACVYSSLQTGSGILLLCRFGDHCRRMPCVLPRGLEGLLCRIIFIAGLFSTCLQTMGDDLIRDHASLLSGSL